MDFTVGQIGKYTKTVEEKDVEQFAELSGDFNPLHINAGETEQDLFDREICHGMLIASYISNVIGMVMPGPGAVYLGQNIKFLKPVYVGDTITVVVEVLHIRTDKNILSLQTTVKNQRKEIVIDGEATVKMLKARHL